MRDDELMDQLLRDALTGDMPRLSPEFDARFMTRLRPRRLTMVGRVVMTVYAVAATAAAVWLMRDLRLELLAAGVTMTLAVAAGASVYLRRLAAGLDG